MEMLVIINTIFIGELSLDGCINRVNGVLPATMAAGERKLGIICPEENGPEALWIGDDIEIVAPRDLMSLINHLKGTQVLNRPEFKKELTKPYYPDLKDVIGQEQAKSRFPRLFPD